MPVPYRRRNAAGLNPAQWAAIAAYLEQGWDNCLTCPCLDETAPMYTANDPEFLEYRNDQDPCPDGCVIADPAHEDYCQAMAPAALRTAADWLLAYPGGPRAAAAPDLASGPRELPAPPSVAATLDMLVEFNAPGGD